MCPVFVLEWLLWVKISCLEVVANVNALKDSFSFMLCGDSFLGNGKYKSPSATKATKWMEKYTSCLCHFAQAISEACKQLKMADMENIESRYGNT